MAETLTVRTKDGSFDAYVALPARTPAAAVVVLQEIFGVNANMREIADGLAGQGYLAVCPDLFWRIEPGIQLDDHKPDELQRAFQLFGQFDVDAGVSDIAATIDAARTDPRCAGKVGAVGFCLGGLLAYLTAARTDVDASISYYGVGLENRLAEADAVRRPLLLHVAGEDRFVPKAAQDQIREGLADKGLIDLYTYPGRDHAFARPNGENFDAADAGLAGRRSLDFFAKALA